MIKEDITLSVDGLKIEGWFYRPEGTRVPPYLTVCICHGIPSGELPEQSIAGYHELATKICRQGFAVFTFSFRGSRNSGGNLDMAGWARDLGAVIDFLFVRPEVDTGRLFLLGFSGGASVSIYVAAGDSRISGVISCASPAYFEFGSAEKVIEYYRSVGAIRDKDFPSSAEEWKEGFMAINPLEHIAGIAPRPMLLVHGTKDETVPVSHAYQLFARAGEPKHLIIIDGAEHRLRMDKGAMGLVMDWLEAQCRI